MSWKEMSLDNREAAKELLIAGRYRSCISRSYYAAYCAVTSVLAGQVDFAHDGDNPTHDALDTMIMNNLYRMPKWERLFVRKAVRRLRGLRVEADYGPDVSVERRTALDALNLMNGVFSTLFGE